MADEIVLETISNEVIVETVSQEVVEVGVIGPQGPRGERGESGASNWNDIQGKPTTFPPSAHTHVAADVTDFASAVAAVSPPVDWATLTGKPSTFAPSAHKTSHATGGSDALTPADIGAATAAQGALADTASQPGHTHSASAITDFNSAVTALVENEVRFDSNGNFTYTGQAAPNTSESTAAWRIRRSEYTGAGTHVATLTATNVRWADRLTASYS